MLDDLKTALATVAENLNARNSSLKPSEENFKKVKKNFETSQSQLREVAQEITKLEDQVEFFY